MVNFMQEKEADEAYTTVRSFHNSLRKEVSSTKSKHMRGRELEGNDS